MKTKYGFKCEYCLTEFTWLSCDFNKHIEYAWHILTRRKNKCLKKGEPIREMKCSIEQSKEEMISYYEKKYNLKISDKDAEDIMKPFGGHILAMMLLHNMLLHNVKRETQA